MSFDVPPARALGPQDPGDGWADGPQGRFWGRFGAAGLLAWDPAAGVLLQHRARWSHHGGTWGIPGGALHSGEDPGAAALREAREEADVPAGALRALTTHVFDVGYWRYTTVLARVVEPFSPRITDPESLELLWVPVHDVTSRELHPGFARAWPELREMLRNVDRTDTRGEAT